MESGLPGLINFSEMNLECYNYSLNPHSPPPYPMPFLQMLQEGMQTNDEEEQEPLQLSFVPESNLQLLLRIQDEHRRTSWPVTLEADSCITHASESKSDVKEAKHVVSPHGGAGAATRKRRKRQRADPAAATTLKKVEEVENQRLTHIAVERNRRRLMNEHLAALRGLMPTSFVRRGDQASIVGGAIEFVKELEQHLLSLQAEKRLRTITAGTATTASTSAASSPCTSLSRSNDEEPWHVAADSLTDTFFVAPQYTSYTRAQLERGGAKEDEGVDVEATAVQGHVNVKVAGPRRAGQLVRVVAAIEELRLSVLHLSVTTFDPDSILYSLNLKVKLYSRCTVTAGVNRWMEDECKLTSADEIATAVHQIFTYINACC